MSSLIPVAASGKALPSDVVVHPLVLLGVVDHYNRVAKDSKRRVVGVLLGETFKGRVDVTNCFAVPFEEDPKDSAVWFLDHDYLEAMFLMYKKVNARERIVGFYSSGPKIRPADLAIEALFRDYHPNPVLVIIDVRPECEEIPTQAYFAVEKAVEGKEVSRVFEHVPCEVGAYEAEEVGVEHLLRDINDPSVSTLAAEIRHKVLGLRGLTDRLRQMHTYLLNVCEGRVPANHEILANIQTIVSMLPNLSVESLVKSMFVETNDIHLVLYISTIIRAVIALHDLVLNKLKYKGDEEEKERAKEKEAADKAAAAKAKEESKEEKA